MGELQIIDELQKQHKFEIYLPLKDKGIDFIGVKNNNSVQIQVKTSIYQREDYYFFNLHKSKMVYTKNTFYIFVLYVLPGGKMMGKKRNFLILPSLVLQEMIKNESIVSKKGDAEILPIFIYPDEEGRKWIYKFKGKSVDLTNYWNHFDLLEKVISSKE